MPATGDRGLSPAAPVVIVPWVTHAAKHGAPGIPIHSVHVDRDNKRFATAAASKLVRIWDIAALGPGPGGVQDTPEEAGCNHLLASLDVGSNTCDVARFANTADMLAVGDGDGTLHIFQRRDGTAAVEFGKPVSVARFRPGGLKLRTQGASAICFVVGSMDKRFTVWVEGCNKPWIVTDKKLFDKPILDIAWSPDGKHIFAVTECGKLGHCLFMEERAVAMVEGLSECQTTPSAGRVQTQRSQAQATPGPHVEQRVGGTATQCETGGDTEPLSPGTLTMGPGPDNAAGDAGPSPGRLAAGAKPATPLQPELAGSRGDTGQANASRLPADLPSKQTLLETEPMEGSAPQSTERRAGPQAESQANQKRRRIAPIPIGDAPKTQPQAEGAASLRRHCPWEGLGRLRHSLRALMPLEETPLLLPGISCTAQSALGVSGVSERQGLNSSGKARQGSTGQGVPLDDAAAGSRAAAAAQVVEPVMEAGAQPGAMPSMLRELQRSHPGLPFGEEAPDIENGDLPSSEGLTIELPGSATLTASQWGDLEYAVDGVAVWRDTLPLPAVAACALSTLCLAACRDGLLQVYHRQTGMRVLPAVLLGSKVVSMQAGSAHCLIVTQSRSLLWDAAALEAVCAGRSHEQRERGHARAADIPLPAAHVSEWKLTATGRVIAITSIGDVLAWCQDLKSWLLIADAGRRAPDSEYAFASDPFPSAPRGDMAQLVEIAARMAGPASASGKRPMGAHNLRQSCGQLENIVSACAFLGSEEEGTAWTACYTRFLEEHSSVDSGMKAKLEMTRARAASAERRVR
eukprot:jgi/Tetstr1/424704/TSEL_015222.t1